MKEIQILNNGESLHTIRTKINENFELVNEKTAGLTKFCVNTGNTENDLPDLLEYNDNMISFKVGGQYENVVATNGDNATFTRNSISDVGVNGLADGVYRIFIDDQSAEIGTGEIYSQFTQPLDIQDGDIWFNGVQAVQYIQPNPSLTPLNIPAVMNLYCTASNGGMCIAAGAGTTILRSLDSGNTWSQVTGIGPSGVLFRDCIFVGDTFYLLANSGSILLSKDGLTWTTSTTAQDNVTSKRLKYLNNNFVIVTDTGIIFFDRFGGERTAVSGIIGGNQVFVDICFLNGTYYLISSLGNIFTSSNLTTWENINITAPNAKCCLAYKEYVLIGCELGRVYKFNTNTQQMSYIQMENEGTINDIALISNFVVVTGDSTLTAVSKNGTDFQFVYSDIAQLNKIGNGYIVGIGNRISKFTNMQATFTDFNKVPVGEVVKSGGTIVEAITYPYNVNGLTMASSTNYGVLRTATTEDEVNCSCTDAGITPSNVYKLNDFRTANTQYELNQIVGCPYHNELYLVCVKAGTTSNEALVTSGELTFGQQITDGTVVWQVGNSIPRLNYEVYGEIEIKYPEG